MSEQTTTLDLLLSEILPIPSNEVIHNRFSETNKVNAARCSGKCKSGGGCITSLND